jgi:hypothetical protein
MLLTRDGLAELGEGELMLLSEPGDMSCDTLHPPLAESDDTDRHLNTKN